MENTKKIFEADEKQLKQLISQLGEDAFKEKLKSLLHKQQCTVKFVKKDGTLREMVCTTAPEVITEHFAGTRPKAPNSNVISVWDVTGKAWKSFRFDSIKYLSYEKAEIKSDNLTEDGTTIATPEDYSAVIDYIEDEMLKMMEKERALMMDDAIERELTKYIR